MTPTRTTTAQRPTAQRATLGVASAAMPSQPALTPHDRDVLRPLAARWMEVANQPVMAERKRQWTALKDLHAERPMVLFETWTLEDYVAPDELQCESPALRGVERHLRWVIRHAEEVGDDIVVEPCWRVGWDISNSGYGVPIESHGAGDEQGGHVGYAFDHPIKTPDDLDKLLVRKWEVDREGSLAWAALLQEAFGDLLPVVMHGTQDHHAGFTDDLFRLLGNDNLLVWVYDEPEAIHRAVRYLRDDHLAYHKWLEDEKLLGLNNNGVHVGSGSPGFVSCLPGPGYQGQARLKDTWAWVESQETTCISPDMFAEFFLPYMAEVAALFGLVYYGCCEPVHDRWDKITAAVPHVRAVSISPWCDMREMGEKLGRSVVFSRKPKPGPMSGAAADWDVLGQDLDETLDAAKGCNLELVFRDVYRIAGDRPRLRKWADMAKSRIGC